MRQGHPLAQTFTLQSDDEANEGGRFLTSVDIFFANKKADFVKKYHNLFLLLYV